MDIRMSQETKPILQQLFRQTIPTEQVYEMSLPDDLPDAAEIVFTEAKALLRGKEIENGRIFVKGVIAANILYYSDSFNNIQKAEAQIPFSLDVECNDAEPSCKLICNASVFLCSAKIMAPRRLLIKSETCVSVRCLKESMLVTSCLPAETCPDLMQLRYSKTVYVPVTYCEKSFIVTDTFKLPSQCESISGLLLENTHCTVDDAKIVGSKLILKGTVFCDVLYSSEDSKLPCAADFSTEFSQIIELDRQTKIGITETVLALTGAYFHTEATLSSQERQIYLELHLAAQCIVSAEIEMNYISDAYSPVRQVSLAKERIALRDFGNPVMRLVEARGSLDTESEFEKNLFSVFGASIPRSIEGETGKVLQNDFFVCSLCCDSSGKLKSASGRISYKDEINDDSMFEILSADCTGDLYASLQGKSIDIHLPFALRFTSEDGGGLEVVSTIEIAEENADMSAIPSMILHRYRKGESLWELAKVYHSTTDLIDEANNSAETDNYFDRQLIIIPKYKG